MIDDEKIKKAALSYCAKCLNITTRNIDLDKDKCVDLYNGFIDGANWAINEFLKDLWHPADEEPNHEAIRTYILGKTKVSESGVLPMLLRPNTNWKEFVVSHSVAHWLYVDDLLPKEGGEK